MNPHLQHLQPYPFEKLRRLQEGVRPPADRRHIALSIGEPKHEAPPCVVEVMQTRLGGLSNYPATKGLEALREAIADWATRRFGLMPGRLTAEHHVLPVNGTREALFAFAQCVVDNSRTKPTVLMPNPFYQIYEGAAILAGAHPYFLNCTRDRHYFPDFEAVEAQVWRDCQLLYLCTPGNPTGNIYTLEQLQAVIALADKYDFTIVSDECYSELYRDEDAPPPGLLQACHALGRDDFARCVVFHSLSKRSNVPGLRSGFVAGDAAILKDFLLYRTYHGCAMPTFAQEASVSAWRDEVHVVANRALYRAKYDAVLAELGDCLDLDVPPAGFYLWPKTPIDDQQFARDLFAAENVTVLPGSYLAREAFGVNPGKDHVRLALVATLDECVEAARRIRRFVEGL